MARDSICLKTGLKRGTWTREEDAKLCAYVRRYGHLNWRLVPAYAGLARCGKSCRLRWMNYLRPNIKRGDYTAREEEIIIRMHKQLGTRWSVIATCLPGRTDNEIKNYWHAQLKRRNVKPKDPKEAKLKHVVHEILSDADHQPSVSRPLILESSGMIPASSTPMPPDFLPSTSREVVEIENEVEAGGNIENETWDWVDSYISSTSSIHKDAVTDDFSEFDLDFWNESFGSQHSHVSPISALEDVVLDDSLFNSAKSEASFHAASEFAPDFSDEPFVIEDYSYMWAGSGSECATAANSPARKEENEIMSDNTVREIDEDFWMKL